MSRQASPPVSKRAERNLRGKDRAVAGPYEAIVLRLSNYNRVDRLNFTVEVRPIGTRRQDVIVARFKDPEDAKLYGSVLARRSGGCRLIDHV